MKIRFVIRRAGDFAAIASILLLGFGPSRSLIAAEPPRIALITDAKPGLASAHGLAQLKTALRQKGVAFEEATRLEPKNSDLVIVAGLAGGKGAADEIRIAQKVEVPSKPESLVIRFTEWNGKTTLLLAGADDRGLMYALLDTADRIAWAAHAASPLSEVREAVESPSVPQRALSIYTMHRAAFEQRFFDEAYWASYFDMLARDRFDSFVLIFGYENGGYFAPAYPYFFDVEGFPDVRVVDFSASQQQRYLRALNRMIQLAHDRGLDFTVGLWDHIYRGGVQSGGVKEADPNKPMPGIVWGLSKTNLTAYSTAALAKFLKLVPGLDVVQFRMHSESGLKPGAEMREFWRAIYQVVREVRPGLRFDARAKEFPDELIDLALDMGINIRICTKYWAEQMGLPFHATHINRQNQFDRRHGYADLLRHPQRYKMHWRLWSGGTTRVLLWGDPEYARRFAQSSHLYDGDGFEVNEMLATKMEAQPHDQSPFELLRPQYRYFTWEFERYWHYYQVFGRIGYNPDTPPEIWQREFQRRFGPEAAPCVEDALHLASRILPRINASLFPYNRFPMTRGWVEKQRWEDLPAYANCEGSDTQQFLSFAEAAKNRLEGSESAKLHPEQNSAWLEKIAHEILRAVAEAEQRVGSHRNKEFDSTLIDLRILANLAAYHSRRIHAGLNYALFKQSQDLNALDDAISHERRAIEAWERIVQAAGDVYSDDLMMGLRSAGLAGHWKDELAALRNGLAALQRQRSSFTSKTDSSLLIAHVPVRRVRPGDTLSIRATVTGPAAIESVRLAWRAAGQDYKHLPMTSSAPGLYHTRIPESMIEHEADYFIEVEHGSGSRTTFPREGAAKPFSVRVAKDLEAPLLTHTPVKTARAGQPLKITARVSDPAGVKWARVRYRGVTQFQDYQTVEMKPTADRDEYEAVVPGEQIVSRWDFMYLFEVMDQNGNGKIYPDLEKETPYVVVQLRR
ncbi:MAG: hypothetical protein HY735_34405 [Verrucomicrobia bacterium]|nr:hypothetical protein [Verrucomicrobiota bacterium]